MVFAWAIAAANTCIAYVTFGSNWIPIMIGVLLCFAFTVLLILLHRAWWLALLSTMPSLFVLVGSVQYAPEGALDRLGVRESVVVAADSAAGTSSKNHRLTLRGMDGNELEEKLTYRGRSGAPEVGDRLDIVRDPDGKVPMAQADTVDASGEFGTLVGGTVMWTLMAILAGRRGHVLRRRGHELGEPIDW
ncbi:hypothetical protein Q5762_19915 [Streptomyces sp. P9(2023)]|uniref:hypothetical protein n=1 Tax=Streptomyces sp. P9(2023) TaxID=3064394 RepID=UPI0028F3F391|nr:hypothetical protein [Streptomyces sp. P9(2023)]MDT9690568.1 hypothetical protein [Streptomyces sp. P9(2023)]